MKIDKNQKINILNQALYERYRSVHIIRERVQTVSIWILGILLTAAGWLFQSNICFSLSQKVVAVLLLLTVWIALRLLYFADLEKGFNGQRQVAAKIEGIIGLFDKAFCSDLDDSIYPKSWEWSGKKGSEGRFFGNTYNLLAIGFGIISFIILILK